jgi:hypothetical protein
MQGCQVEQEEEFTGTQNQKSQHKSGGKKKWLNHRQQQLVLNTLPKIVIRREAASEGEIRTPKTKSCERDSCYYW